MELIKVISKNENKFFIKKNFIQNCSDNHDLFAENFILNQKKMKEISEIRDARHIVIIQPVEFLHQKFKDKNFIKENKDIIEYYNKVINEIMKSDFCKKDCYDMSKYFDNFNSEIEVYKFDKQLKNNFFYDDINLLDDGYFELSNRIGAIINKYLIQ